jgi:hypothetical protein
MRTFRLGADHPDAGIACCFCRLPIAAWQECYLEPGEPADAEEMEKKAAGRPYTATAQLAHLHCRPNSAKESRS